MGLGIDYQPSIAGIDEHLDVVAESQYQKAVDALKSLPVALCGEFFGQRRGDTEIAELRYEQVTADRDLYGNWRERSGAPEHRSPEAYAGLPL